MDEIDYFIPQDDYHPSGVLDEYLTSPGPDFLQAYLNCYTQPGDVVLDPFCQNSDLALEALRLGRKAILSDSNPITTFVSRASLSNLTSQQLSYAFVRLSEGAKMQTSLRAHINQLYTTTCPRCHLPAIVSYFTWSRDENRPIKRHYSCQTCKPSNGIPHVFSEPADEADLEALKQVEPRGFHYWYVVDRLAPEPGWQQTFVKQMLELYTPRNLYALVMVLMQIESTFDNPSYQDALKLTLLECLDSCSKLNAIARNARPWTRGKDLRPPSRFIERNVWEAFEETFKHLNERLQQFRNEGLQARFASGAEQLIGPGPRAQTDDLPNILVERLPARSLTDDLPDNCITLILSEAPSPERSAFQDLSYLWTGWLFGREQAMVFEGQQKTKQKVDWVGYFKEILGGFRALRRVLNESGTLVLHYSTSDYVRCNLLVIAGIATGLQLRRILYQPIASPDNVGGKPFSGTPGRYCMHFVRPQSFVAAQRVRAALDAPVHQRKAELRGSPSASEAWSPLLEQSLKSAVGQAIRDILWQRAEPLVFNWLNVSVYEHLAKDGLLLQTLKGKNLADGTVANDLRKAIDDEVREILSKDYRQVSCGEEANSLWWFVRKPFSATPVSEQLEKAIYNILSTNPNVTDQNVTRVVHSLFPGALAPEPGWIEQVLESYATHHPALGWVLRPEDHLQKRLQEHASLIAGLTDLGHRLGYKVWIGRDQQKQSFDGKPLRELLTLSERSYGPTSLLGGTKGALIDVVWYDHALPTYIFEVEWTATLGEAVFSRRVSASNMRKYLVVPQERASLIQFKLERSPWFKQALDEDGWDFIKFGHLMEFVAKEEHLDLFSLGKIIGLQPVAERESGQLRMF
ncbi:MAG: hypothetical protein M0T85_00420 [Dehalococcoidales bacterium]|nr:hypothetical protein [Dehalococcoidales bacterium]